MLRALCIAPALLTLTLMALPCFAPDASARQGRLVVLTEESPPFNYSTPDGIRGVSTEMVRAAFAEAGLEGDFFIWPWARAYQTAAAEPGACIYSMARTPERDPLFAWIGRVAQVRAAVFARKEGTIRAETLEDLRPYSIGGVRMDFAAQWLAERGVDMHMAADDLLSLRKLARGRIDLLVNDVAGFDHRVAVLGLDRKDFVKVLDIDELSVDLWLACNPGTDPGIVNALRRGLAEARRKRTETPD